MFFQTLNDFYDDEFYNGNEYIVFGSDGEGNPFCIDKLNENKIVLLDFDGEKIISTNNSLSEYLDSILTYKNFNDAIIIKYGEDALFDNLYKEEDIEKLKNQFLKINANLVTNSEFWKYQIEELVANKNACS